VIAALFDAGGRLLCMLGRHKPEIVRVLKPWLHLGVNRWLGCDLRCARCGVESSWAEQERVWHADFRADGHTDRELALLPGVEHPNSVCPCRLCRSGLGERP
jgi:hypothetical protein